LQLAKSCGDGVADAVHDQERVRDGTPTLRVKPFVAPVTRVLGVAIVVELVMAR
jgi:hypothetical protein